MRVKIYLAFINNYLPVKKHNFVKELRQSLPFQFESITIPVELELYYAADRNQYYSTLILAQLIKQLPEDGLKIVGITQVDLFIPILTFVFGEAQLNGVGALVSTFRLRNEFYGLVPNEKLFHERIVKELVHELGHTFGLVHCPDYNCVMHSSTYVEDTDLKQARYCPNCDKDIRQKISERGKSGYW